MNFAGHWHTFDVDQPDAVLLSWGEAGSYGVVCCATDLRYLSENPISFERELTDYLRFDKPGTYRFSSPLGGSSKKAENISTLTPARFVSFRTFSK